MGFPVTELISDSLNKYTAVLFGDGIFSFLRTEIRISFEKFLRVNKSKSPPAASSPHPDTYTKPDAPYA